MGKEQRSSKETKKKPALSAKEKKVAKADRKGALKGNKGFLV